ncbi:DNA-binding transcriptional regulator, MocR family, contains an aminotransferase domain [Goodfellowiella coeruleoviolacea]|uniref:DNA-binding transcriptional regulator, MocR family, contains an aminotransferase domain n=2 Tax=Goodfellowiella coeruleoviolacea TaxID=334858 RepID=A0AAE3KGM1_9PSEU|nr:DNA-binding transcriptional regulator, MocR family, contains an aminotransferase domain [Goodfellowiella coeruleoviolacea]
MSARRLSQSLGHWRRRGARQGSADLAAGIRMLVLDGRLPPGTRLPAERELTEALGVSRTMVTAALEQLRADGLVASRRGAGSWVALPRGTGSRGGDTPMVGHGMIDLARAAPFAMPGVAAAIEAATPRVAGELAEHGYYEYGIPELRQRIADRYVARGLPTTADQILVTNGAQHAFALALQLLVSPGDRVLVESPTYCNILDSIRAAHAIPVPVALTEDGWDLDGVEAALRQAAPRLAYFIVDFHNPTGLRLDAEGRQRLTAALTRTRTLAMVDETYVEIDLEGDPLDGPPPVASFAEDVVITIGSASKAYWGGLRLGWLRAPREMVNRLVSVRPAIDLGSPVFEQVVLAQLLADSDRLLPPRRRELARLRDVLAEELRATLPEWSFRLPSGGLNLWCHLPAPVSTRIAVSAQNHGLRLAPGSRFSAHGGLERWLRLPFVLAEDVLRDAVRRLGLASASVCGADAGRAGGCGVGAAVRGGQDCEDGVVPAT